MGDNSRNFDYNVFVRKCEEDKIVNSSGLDGIILSWGYNEGMSDASHILFSDSLECVGVNQSYFEKFKKKCEELKVSYYNERKATTTSTYFHRFGYNAGVDYILKLFYKEIYGDNVIV